MKISAVLIGLLTLSCMCAVIWSCSDKGNNDDDKVVFWPDVPQTEIDIDPAWSPDGSKIIYFRNFNGDSDQHDTQWVWGVFLHDTKTGSDSLLWASLEATDFDWSPDGQLVAFKQDAQIFISDLSRLNIQHIETDERSHAPQWSPCGDRLLYFIRLGNTRGMYIYYWSTNSSHLRVPLATHGSWMNGCDSVAMISYSDADSSDLSVYSLGTRTHVYLPRIDSYKRGISAAPNGRSILIARDGYGANTNIWKFDLDSSKYSQLTTEGGNSPDWSPDGQWIVYTKVDSLNGYLWLMRPDGSDKHQITF